MVLNPNGAPIEEHGAMYDALSNTAEAAGVNMDSCYLAFANGQLNAPVTSTMRAKFAATGAFEVLTDSKYLTTDAYLRRGDILVKETAHTVMVLSNGSMAGDTNTDKEKEYVRVWAQKLQRGDKGNAVMVLQWLLNSWAAKLGKNAFYCGAADGDFGAKTQAGVMGFQREYGLSPTGITDSTTWEYLMS